MISACELEFKEGKNIEKCCPFAIIPRRLDQFASRLREIATAARTAGFEGLSPSIEGAFDNMSIGEGEVTSGSDGLSDENGTRETTETQSTGNESG